MLAANSILQNRYRVIRELGHGGMGTVYEALDQRVNCIVALKETMPGNNDEARRAFQREASLLGNLRHSALPKVMDYFSEDNGDFLIMEFIPGYDLAELLKLRGSPFPEAQVMRWSDELLKVLEYLHSQQPPILHRDIKPSNLKLTKEGEVFLLDFGLAKGSLGQMPTLATSRSVRGYTPVYASLEQIHGHGTDARSDIYSFGATLYHLLAGFAPIDAPARFYAVEEDKPDPLVPIQSLNSEVSAGIAQVVHQAMSIRRKHRPRTAAEMRRALRNASDEDEQSRTADAYSFGEFGRPESEDENQRAVSASTIRSEDDGSAGALMPPTERPVSTPSVSTVPAPPPRRFKQVFMVVAALLTVGIVGSILVWAFLGNATQDSSTSQTEREVPSPERSANNQGQAGIPHPSGMVYVPGGAFTMGRENGDDAERPPHQVTVKAFFIDTHEVTNEDYEKFVKATNRRAPASWKKGSFPAGAERKPVTGVTWDDANDYARWAGKRLPTEEEWEFAARGSEGRVYPWGNDWRDGSANANGAGQSMADVAAHKGTSPFGTFDMVGNAWEWTASNFKPYPGRGLPGSQPSGDLRVIRGGCYESTKDYATTTYRAGWPARGASTYDQTGFRCAKDVGP
ncbi:MAG TPA: bifunctional serine/threonine-protein kinase/formylglycine-generating enzyme family protein [Pyrinomonadaceae bacterium]|nr:bifunctional serine/threonine-protein kinase/formylglycine-generating enzyme family protein [Pyrinomonadaceae bacterium]